MNSSLSTNADLSAGPPDSAALGAQRKTVLITTALAFLLMATGTVIRLVGYGLEDPPIPAAIVTLLAGANVVYLLAGGSARTAAAVLVGLLVLGMAYVGHNSGGFDGPIVLLAPLAPVLAFSLLDKPSGWLTTAAILIILSSLYIANLLDLLPANTNRATDLVMGRWLVIAASGIFITWVAMAYEQRILQLAASNWRDAHEDHLTGLPNRRALEQVLVREAGRARRAEATLTCVMSDIDHFKRYNDRFGHSVGDACLKAVADVLAYATRRPADFAARYGGEEFLLILPGTNSDGAREVVERVRSLLQVTDVVGATGEHSHPTMTFGVVTIAGSQIDSVDQLLRSADSALYEGKQAGRDRAVYRVVEAGDA